MADQQREYEDYRRDRRREWNERGFGNTRRENFGEFGSRGQESDQWQRSPEGRSFGGQRPYARDLYSDSGISRHETDWQSGSAGRSMQSVYSGAGGYRGWDHGDDFVSPAPRGRANWDRPGNRETGFAGRGPKDYQRSDERIYADICDRMTDDDSLDASDISVQVNAGEVTLTGTVNSRDQKRRAEGLAESISGVREVTNSIRLSRDQSDQRSVDLQRGTSIQVGQSGRSGESNPSNQASSSRAGSKIPGTSGTGAGGIS